MRLSERKIKYLSHKLTNWMAARKDVELLDRDDVIELAIARAMVQELRIEDDLDDEVEKVLKTYQTQIRGQNMDMSVLRLKIKNQLAREKGIDL